MILNINNWLKYYQYKFKFQGCKVDLGTRVTSDSKLIKSNIGKDCRIISSELIGSNIIINSNSHIVNSELIGSNIKIDSNCHIVNSAIANNDVSIAKSSSVIESVFKGNINIDKKCSLHKTKLDGYVLLHQECLLSEVNISSFTYVAMRSKILNTMLGKFCSIGPYVICGPGDHPINWLSTSPAFYLKSEPFQISFSDQNEFKYEKETVIGNDVWVGAGVFIKNGIKIGNGAIIAAGAVVVKDVPDYAIVGGVPAKIIRFRFPENIINELLKIQWWNWDNEKLKKAQPFFIKEDISTFIEWAQSEVNC